MIHTAEQKGDSNLDGLDRFDDFLALKVLQHPGKRGRLEIGPYPEILGPDPIVVSLLDQLIDQPVFCSKTLESAKGFKRRNEKEEMKKK